MATPGKSGSGFLKGADFLAQQKTAPAGGGGTTPAKKNHMPFARGNANRRGAVDDKMGLKLGRRMGRR